MAILRYWFTSVLLVLALELLMPPDHILWFVFGNIFRLFQFLQIYRRCDSSTRKKRLYLSKRNLFDIWNSRGANSSYSQSQSNTSISCHLNERKIRWLNQYSTKAGKLKLSIKQSLSKTQKCISKLYQHWLMNFDIEYKWL